MICAFAGVAGDAGNRAGFLGEKNDKREMGD
jgi:hypothetical protein